MDCIICVKPFIPEREFGNYHRNPELCASAISKLFKISRNPDVQGVLEDIVICRSCHRKLEEVEDLVVQFEELQRKIDEKRIEFKQELTNSKDVSELMATSRNLELSKSSLDRLTLLKAIETGNTLPPAPDHEIEAENTDKSSEEEQDRATDDSEIDDSVRSANERAILPPGARMFKDVKIYLERVKIPPGVPTINRKVNSNLIPSNSKGGYALRNKKTTAKAIEESSNEESGSESESVDGSSSEDDSEYAGGSKRKSKVNQSYSKQPRRARGSIIKEFTRLKNGSFRCKHCSKILTNKNSSWTHFLIHGPPRFTCSVKDCGKRFTRKGDRDAHVKMVHERRRDFKCSRCSKMFSTLQYRNIHLKTVHEGRRFKCTWAGCGRSYAQESSLFTHIKVIHECRKDFKCELRGCGKAFGTKQQLQIHMSSKHKKMGVSKKKKVVTTPRSIRPQAHVRPNLKVEIFECRMTPSCRHVYALETERDAHEETHSKN